MHRHTRPPPLAAWLLSRLLHGPRSGALLGDLAEEYAHRRSRAWYWRQTLYAIAAQMRQQPPRGFGMGTLRLLLIVGVIVGTGIDAKWPFFLLALDPSWLLLLRWHRKHRHNPAGA